MIDEPPADPAFWRGRRVAVTGATGFLGSHLVARLVDTGAEVTILVRDDVPPTDISLGWLHQVRAVRGDVCDVAVVERLLAEYGIQSLCHLAAQSQVQVANRNPMSTFETNVAGTWAVLEAVRRCGTVDETVTASSDKAYGSPDRLPYTEDMPLLGCHPYDASKACADIVARSYATSFGLNVSVARCGNFFGPGDVNWDRIVPGTFRSVLSGERPVIRSDGSLLRDYLYVEDGAHAYLRLIERMAADPTLSGEAFNFSSAQPMSVLEMVGTIQRAAGTAFEPDVRGTATNEIDAQHLSVEKASRILSWRPTVELDEAMRRTASWYRAHLHQTA